MLFLLGATRVFQNQPVDLTRLFWQYRASPRLHVVPHTLQETTVHSRNEPDQSEETTPLTPPQPARLSLTSGEIPSARPGEIAPALSAVSLILLLARLIRRRSRAQKRMKGAIDLI